MGDRLLSRLDATSSALLLLWAGGALGLALFAPTVFGSLPSRELAGSVVGAMVRRLDIAAWVAFGLPLVLSFGSRWLEDFKEEGIGPLRLWTATATVALLMCLTSAAIITPKLEEIRRRAPGPMETLPEDHPDRQAHRKAHGISRQLLLLRVLLALGLAAGTAYLPKKTA